MCFIKQSEAATKRDHTNSSAHQYKSVSVHHTQLDAVPCPRKQEPYTEEYAEHTEHRLYAVKEQKLA